MLHNLLENKNIVLKKGQKSHIIFQLLWNHVLKFKLFVHKKTHGIRHPIVHYYAVCWNEEKMLPFMFAYYEQFVDHFTIYDNYSDDKSEAIVTSHPNADIIKFQTDGFNDNVHNDIKNNCWKQSRGKADFVIVCDMDEFLYHPDIQYALMGMKRNGQTIAKPYGYNMYSSDEPIKDIPLTTQVPCGVRNQWFDKCILFNPHAIVEINYKPGAHECYPWGRVKKYQNEDFKLLHYKNIGLKHLLEKNRAYATRLSKENIDNNYGTEYLKKEKEIVADFYSNLENTTKII